MATAEIPITSVADAERLIAEICARTDALASALESEAALIGSGRIRDGLAGEMRKAELAAAYTLGLQRVKANIVALKRLAPASLKRLRLAQEAMAEVAGRNGAVLATAKAVSESLVKGMADAVAKERAPSGYAPMAAMRSAQPCPGPMVFSARF